MLVSTTLEQHGPITDEERTMPEKAKTLPAAFDRDCPELSEEDLKDFRHVIMKNESSNGPLIRKLDIGRFRGVNGLEINGLSNINIITGANDSGKTSVLEALGILGRPCDFGHAAKLAMPRARSGTASGRNAGMDHVLGLFRKTGGGRISIGSPWAPNWRTGRSAARRRAPSARRPALPAPTGVSWTWR